MSTVMDASILEGGLARYVPSIVALTTDTKDAVDFGGVLQQIMKSVPWSGSTVIDRLEVCQWFVNTITDTSFAATVAEVRAQLPPPGQDAVMAIDSNLVSICIKHKIMSVAYEREVKRLAALERDAREREDMIEQFMEDGMSQAAAIAEADRELAVEEDDEDPVEPPPDIVILKHFPQTVADYASLDKVGVLVNMTLVLNSQARFGRKEEVSIDPKDKAQRRRLDAKKPDVRRGKAGREDQDRQEPLAVQVTRELSRIGYLERSVLRESAFFTYNVQCVDAGVGEDGTKLYRAKESEGAVADALNKELSSMLESAMRYRLWIGNKTFLRVPKLNIRRVVADQAKPVVPLPTSSKTTKKGRGKGVEVEAPREEAPPLPLLPDLPPSCSHLPISNSTFRKSITSLSEGGVALDAVSLLHAVLDQIGSFRVGEDALMVDGDRVRDDVSVANGSVESLKTAAASLVDNLIAALDKPSLVASMTPSSGGVATTFAGWRASLETRIVSMLMESPDGENPPQQGAVNITCPVEEANRLVALAAQRGEIGGAVFSVDSDDISSTRLDITTTTSDRRARYHLLSSAFLGRVPFPVFLAWERYGEMEWEHYNPLPNDDEELFEEEEEEEEELDEDGVPIPRPPRQYPIEYRNFSEERSQLIRRRAVYDTLIQRLRPSSAQVLEACTHLIASATNETFAMHPGDGSTICAHRSATSTDSASCVVYSEGGDTSFGFHAHRGLLYRMPDLPTTTGEQANLKSISSGVRCFFSDVRSQLRMVVESSVHDPTPPRQTQQKRHDVPLPVPDTTSSGKRNNTPRGQKSASIVTPSVTIADDHTSSQRVDRRPPRLHVTLSSPNGFECVATPDHLTLGSNSKEVLRVAVFCSGEVLVAEDVVVEWTIFSDGIIKVIGCHTSLTIFPNGDMATQCGGVWLYTAVSGARRAYSPAYGAIDLTPVAQATQTAQQSSRRIRDDFVVTDSSPGSSVTVFASLVTMSTKGSIVSYTCGSSGVIEVVVDGTGVNVQTGPIGVALRDQHLIVECTAARSCVLDWTTGLLFVDPSPAKPVHYAIDCIRGGLKSRDETQSYIVSPFGRVWQGPISIEEATTPRDLTTKHIVDRFADVPEVVSPLFEAALQLSRDFPLEASLYFRRGFPEIPRAALRSRLLAPKRDYSAMSSYMVEYVKDVERRIDTVLSRAEANASTGCSVYTYTDDGQCLAAPVSGEYAYLRQRLLHKDPVGLYCHTAPGSTVFLLEGEDPIVLVDGQSSDVEKSPSELVSDAKAAASTNVTPIIRSRVINSIVPIAGGGPLQHVQSSSWISPVDELHACLSQTQNMKHNYWCSSGIAAEVKPYTLPLAKESPPPANTKKSLSPPRAPPLSTTPPQPRSYANPTPPALPIQAAPPKRNMRVLQATPAELAVGDMSVGYQYRSAFALTNLTTKSCRFRVTSNVPSVSVTYEQVPMAAGMTTTVVVLINCTAQGETHVKLKVAYEGGSMEVPCTFNGLECINSKVVVPGPAQVIGLIAA